MVLGRLAPVPKLSCGGGVRGVVGHDHAAFTHGPEILARIKTEATEISDAADAPPLVFGINRLRGVLDDAQATTRGDVEDGVKIRRVPVQVHWDDGLCPRR